MTILKVLFIFFQTVFAHEAMRIDKNSIEDFKQHSHKYELIIADNCAHCLRQVSIMKECVKEEDVVVLVDNVSKLSEEQLKRLIIKKKIPYKAYLLDNELRKSYEFDGITPVMHMNSQKIAGVISCDFLKKN